MCAQSQSQGEARGETSKCTNHQCTSKLCTHCTDARDYRRHFFLSLLLTFHYYLQSLLIENSQPVNECLLLPVIVITGRQADRRRLLHQRVVSSALIGQRERERERK